MRLTLLPLSLILSGCCICPRDQSHGPVAQPDIVRVGQLWVEAKEAVQRAGFPLRTMAPRETEFPVHGIEATLDEDHELQIGRDPSTDTVGYICIESNGKKAKSMRTTLFLQYFLLPRANAWATG